MTDRPNVVWIVVDRFHAGMLGPYGNAWIRTPNLNRLAADAFLFDQALIDTPALDGFYRGCWLGRHALTPLAADVGAKSLPAELAAANFETRLWTDDCSVANHSLAAEFAQTEVIPIESSRVAGELEDTHFARFFSAAIDGLQQLAAARNQGASGSRPFVAWLHTAGLGSVWDAPLEFRNQYADDEDALPPEAANVPTLMLREDFDPDELLGFVHAYAGQVSLLDARLGLLLDELQTRGLWQNTLLGRIGAGGFPRGRHRRLGPM